MAISNCLSSIVESEDMTNQKKTAPTVPSEDAVLRRMLSTRPKPHQPKPTPAKLEKAK